MSEPAPSWGSLHEVANGQSGHFTAQQASDAGFSPQLLHKHVQSGNLCRPIRGIYRITRFPPSEHEDLVILWLWSDQEAVFSHETALNLHDLSDALPGRVHLTLPTTTSKRKKTPDGVVVHFADIQPRERQWFGPVPLTRPARTVLDVAAAHGDAGLVAQAIDEGIRQGLFTFDQVAPAGSYVAHAQGWGTPIRPDGLIELGDSYHVRGFSGVCSKPPPADWPTLAAELGGRLGGHLRVAQYHPSRTMQLEYAWRLERAPDDRDGNELRRHLARQFAWA
ncbi:MAG: hypothetical protein R3F61_32390 [Myxococcota bacterium]